MLTILFTYWSTIYHSFIFSKGLVDITAVDEFDMGKAMKDSDRSIILVRPLNETSSSTVSDWTIALPPGESCRVVALVPGKDQFFAVAATSSRMLRIFLQPGFSAGSANGSLRLFQSTNLGLPPLSLPGKEVVTMCSHPTLPILAVVIGWSNEDLYWRVYNFSASEGVPRGWVLGQLSMTYYPLPLSPSSNLTWIGFSDVGNLFTHDSCGCVRRLTHHRSGGGDRNPMDFPWIPVCDTRRSVKPRKRRTDCFFVVGIVENVHRPTDPNVNKLGLHDEDNEDDVLRMERIRKDDLGYGHVQAIYCKASRWPRPIPRPIVTNLPFRLPLCGVYETDQGDLEENFLRTLVLDQKPFWGLADNDDDPLEDSRLRSRRRTLLRLFAVSKASGDSHLLSDRLLR